jgi:hypothetical protein
MTSRHVLGAIPESHRLFAPLWVALMQSTCWAALGKLPDEQTHSAMFHRLKKAREIILRSKRWAVEDRHLLASPIPLEELIESIRTPIGIFYPSDISGYV